MGQVLLRAIEVKYKDKWQLLPIVTVKDKHYDNKADEYIDSEKIGEYYKDYIEEASLRLRDEVFGWGCDNEMKKAVPNDASQEVLDILVDKDHTYCISLEDWIPFINKKEAEFKLAIRELYDKINFKQVNDKLDCLLQNKTYNFEKTDDEIDDEDEEIKYLEDDVWIEKFYLVIALNNEYNYIYDLIYTVYEGWPETRIYYFID